MEKLHDLFMYILITSIAVVCGCFMCFEFTDGDVKIAFAIMKGAVWAASASIFGIFAVDMFKRFSPRQEQIHPCDLIVYDLDAEDCLRFKKSREIIIYRDPSEAFEYIKLFHEPQTLKVMRAIDAPEHIQKEIIQQINK